VLKKRLFSVCIVLLALAVGMTCIPCVQVVSIADRKNFAENIYSRSALEGFVISYTHSVNKGRIHDYYACRKIDHKNIFILEKSVFVSYGAGIPEPEEIAACTFEVTDTGYVLNDLNKKLDTFLLAVGVIAEHSITIGGNEYFLKNYFPAQTSLVFSIKRIPVLFYILSINKWGV
jgi:hypothetical protein